MINPNLYQRCNKGLWDSSIPRIKFDINGFSNYYYMYKRLEKEFPRGKKGENKWNKVIKSISRTGAANEHDCIIGLSGGTDSSYLLHLAVKEWGLRPLAVTIDNGWNSDIAVANIKKMTDALNVSLETYVINYEEVKVVLKAYMRSGLPWIDGPTDRAIKSVLYKIAAQENIKTILVGTDFRSEGKQPEEWTHNDNKLFDYVVKNFGGEKVKSYPNMSLVAQIYYGAYRKIKKYQPFYHINYNKKDAQNFLIKNYNWEYYGGHHHENLFTKFSIVYWLYEKFKIDKRIITFSAQVLSGEMSRDEALQILKECPYDPKQMELDRNVVLKKLDISPTEFDKIWRSPNKTFHDYPSHYNFFIKNKKLIKKYSHLIMPSKPKMIVVED
tara:strand:+ start:678 stop:1829 length:1152 start_codon:yes stop_codon:yes gene_type:complete